MPDVEFRNREDGSTYPITKKRGGAVAAAAGVGLLVASGGVGGLGAGGAAGGSAVLSGAESAVVRAVQSQLPKAKRTARRSGPAKAWRQLRLRKGRQREDSAAACRTVSFGQVQDFLTRGSCRAVRRVQYPLTDDEGDVLTVLVSRVHLTTSSDAAAFKHLIDRHGTGDIRPVVPVVRFTGHHYDSDRDGSTVLVAEAEPLDGTSSAEVLQATAEAAIALAPR